MSDFEGPNRRSTRLQRSSNKVSQPEDADFELAGITESESEKTPPIAKKRKISHKVADKQKSIVKKTRGIRGKLKVLKEMPLDILFEIFSQLDPKDLLNISQTSKELRAVLLSRSSISVWKAARSNIDPPLPDCPTDLNEPQYAELLFGKCCHYCDRKSGTIQIVFQARTRICNSCIKQHCSTSAPAFEHTLRRYAPYAIGPRRGRRQDNYYFMAIVHLWMGDLKRAGDNRQEWLRLKIIEREAIEQHAVLCKNWLELCSELQKIEHVKIVNKRIDEIRERVVQLGWGDEAEKMTWKRKFHELDEIREACKKEFTRQFLETLDAEIHKFMSNVQRERLARERKAFLMERLPVLKQVNNKHLNNFPVRDRYWYPMASEIYREPEIRDIVNDASLSLTSMQEQLEQKIPQIFPNVVKALRRRIDDQLFAHITGQCPEQELDRETTFRLATTIFKCDHKCTRILRYDDAVVHRCMRQHALPEEIEDRDIIRTCLEEGYRSHEIGIKISETGTQLIPILIKLCGLDPSTTTAQMMDDLNPIFECIRCGNQKDGRATMTWLGATYHFAEPHTLERLNQDDEAIVRKRIDERRERAWAAKYYDNKLLQCGHCMPQRVLNGADEVRAHVKESHAITEPKFGKDVILSIDVNHIPDVFYLWPPRNYWLEA